ncbi:glutamine--fructose-6-phosphate transaminase (isomerizing) [Nocardia sp. NPDC057353]|uniref:glutamine--fructose-6-phosphate transaminase (isomerizing) n=1 Tax=Nocardia sp. NPDC057353 TaxID=3346104 RepID=UPI003642BF48
MCGIVGMTAVCADITRRTAECVGTLEYRGYDSWGLAWLDTDSGALGAEKDTGSIGQALLAGRFDRLPEATLAIGHTRWATHGGVEQRNAHPHLSFDRRVAVVHNGVIENHAALRRELEAADILFTSATDSEVAAHLIAQQLAAGTTVLEAIMAVTARLDGEYALGIVCTADPTTVWGAKHKSPLVVAHAGDCGVLASDQLALTEVSDTVQFLEDGDVVAVRPTGVQLWATDNRGRPQPVQRAGTTIDTGNTRANRGDFPHWMIKEIHDVPEAIATVLAMPRERFDCAVPTDGSPIILAGAGSAYYVAQMGQYLLAELAGLRSTALPSDEAGYLALPRAGEAVIAISQSGETFDTLEICRNAVQAGATLTSVCNVPNSTQERLATHRLQQGSGTEICVLSTKSIISQVVVLTRLALEAGRADGALDSAAYAANIDALAALPTIAQEFIADSALAVQVIASKYSQVDDWFFIGRGLSYPAACESALKFKEVSYTHAEGMAAGFFKHGTISLIHPSFFTVAFVPSRNNSPGEYAATMAAVSEITARSGPVIGIGPADIDLDDRRGFVEYLPLPMIGNSAADLTLHLIAGQLLAYYCALDLGREIDKPRALAKSVTVR